MSSIGECKNKLWYIQAMDYYSEDISAQRGILSWGKSRINSLKTSIKENKKKIRKAVISGALGGVVGWVLGGGAGAVSAGVSSAYAAWNSDKISIQISRNK